MRFGCELDPLHGMWLLGDCERCVCKMYRGKTRQVADEFHFKVSSYNVLANLHILTIY